MNNMQQKNYCKGCDERRGSFCLLHQDYIIYIDTLKCIIENPIREYLNEFGENNIDNILEDKRKKGR